MWGEAIDDWAEELRLEGCAMTTIRTRRQHLEQLSRERTEGPWEHTTGSLLEWVAAHEWSIESRHAARSSLRSFYGHAVQRTLGRQVPYQAVEDAIANPYLTYDSDQGPDRKVLVGTTRYGRDLSVVVQWPQADPEKWHVITCWWKDSQ